MHIVVTGSRDYSDKEWFHLALDGFGQDIESIAHGNAKGADTLADEYAKAHGIPVFVFHADWSKHGRGAGPIRNTEMLRGRIAHIGKINLTVFAFTNKPLEESRGTNNCVTTAVDLGLKVIHFDRRLNARGI